MLMSKDSIKFHFGFVTMIFQTAWRTFTIYNIDFAECLTMARCNENDSVERYRDHYMRLEELPGIDMSKVSQPHDLLTKIRDRCNDKGYEPLLARSFVIPGESSAQNASTPKHSIRVMQWNLLAQGTVLQFSGILCILIIWCKQHDGFFT